MKAYGASTRQLTDVIREMGFRARPQRGGNIAVFTEWEGTPVDACPHDYALVIEALLRRYPEARVETAVTEYLGFEDFNQRRRETLQQALRRFPCHGECGR